MPLPGILAVPGVVPAIGSVVGAGIGSVSSKHASNQQAQATQAALEFEKEREARRRSEYDRQQADARRAWGVYQQQMSPYRNIAAQYLARYGYKPALWTLGDYAAPGGQRSPGAGVGLAPNLGMGAPRPQGQTLGAMAMRNPREPY